jgi:hypothetical protein
MSFARIQADYAVHRIATYPLREDKVPAVRGYARVGAYGSSQLAMKFPLAEAGGFCAGVRSRVVIGDIDSTDHRLVDDFERRFGLSPLHVETASGKWHLYYRHAGELRKIRPQPDLPIDILGSSNVVCAGSITTKGRYRIVRGSLDDLERLPPLGATTAPPEGYEPIPKGVRNCTLFKQGLREVRHCDDFDALLDVLRTINMECIPTMSDAEVVKTAKSVWRYETTGTNWVGRKARASMDRDEILAFSRDPDAALLLNLLKVSHPGIGDRFAIDQVKTAKLFEWDRGRLRGRIKTLMEMQRVRNVHRGRGKGEPHLYELVR